MVEVNAHSLFSKWFSESGKLVSRLFAKIQVQRVGGRGWEACLHVVPLCPASLPQRSVCLLALAEQVGKTCLPHQGSGPCLAGT